MSSFLRIISEIHLLKIPIVFSSQASSQPTSQKTSLLLLPGARSDVVAQFVQEGITELLDYIEQVEVHVYVRGTLQVHVYSFLIDASVALRPVSHVRGCCRAPRALCLRLLLVRC